MPVASCAGVYQQPCMLSRANLHPTASHNDIAREEETAAAA